MISVEEALQRILPHFHPLDTEDQPLLDALGQVLAEDVIAGFDIPPLANSAMDGYAVRAASTAGASPSQPVSLRVAGELAAGYVYDGRVEPGTVVRIMTGAPLPSGADAIVPFEETDEAGQRAPRGAGPLDTTVRILKAATAGTNVRAAGEDIRAGQRVLERGTVLRPAQLGVLASLGRTTVSVFRRPIVSILSTGDELVAPGDPRPPARIYDSNATGIASAVREFGGIPQLLGVAADTIDDLTDKIRLGFNADLLVTTAGVSRGDYDVVKLVLAREGAIDFWTVNMRPGKPLAFGTLHAGGRRIPHIGLPGNPVSCMVTFEVFGRPAIFTMLGRSEWRRPRIRAVTSDAIPMADERRFFARCIVHREDERYIASLTGSQSSGVLSGLARANGLAVIPEGHPTVQPGEEIEVMLLNWDTEP
ncbi:MAG: molybdopterin molybdotransferase MoeA [Dehalococcoidia bacterium]